MNKCDSDVVKQLIPSSKGQERDQRFRQRRDRSTLKDINGQKIGTRVTKRAIGVEKISRSFSTKKFRQVK